MDLSVELNSLNKVHKIKENILKSGILRTTRFWYKSAKNKRLLSELNINKEQALDFANFIDQMFTKLNAQYPDMWDVHIDFNFNTFNNTYRNVSITNINIIIKYPEITIRNSREEQHVIKDLYVVLPIRRNIIDDIIIGRIEGTRGILSFAEKQVKYHHSHLSSNDSSLRNQFRTNMFCIGSGPLTDILNRIESSLMSIEDFEAILVFLDDFVKWESIEGIPFMYINNISETNNKSPINIHRYHYNTALAEYRINGLISEIKEKNTSLNFGFYKDRIVLNINENLCDVVKNYILQNIPEHSSALIVKKGENDTYYQYTENSNSSAYREDNKYTIFRGQENQFYVENPINNSMSIDSYEVNPVYMKLLINKLNDKIYENAVRKSIIEQQA